jgi:uncharacterized protein (DUF302 family)
MNANPGSSREEIEFKGKRIQYDTTLSFDEVLTKLRTLVGQISIDNLSLPSETRQDFEKKINQHTGSSGFMLMTEIDHGSWIEKFGIKRRLTRWIFGNPLIAITMIRHDFTAGLFVPPDLLLAENDHGVGCSITYLLPSTAIAVKPNPELLKAALELDKKVEALVLSAVSPNIAQLAS